jgi:peptide/nickel transport system substrate-binding protein
MCRLLVRIALALLLLAVLSTQVAAQSQPDGQLTVAFDVSLAPSFLEPAETPGIGTPFVFLYAHRAASL